jgi:hypothetical protein
LFVKRSLPSEYRRTKESHEDKKSKRISTAAIFRQNPSGSWTGIDFVMANGAITEPGIRAAMKQGDKSAVTAKRGEEFRLRFGAVIQAGDGYDVAEACHRFVAPTAPAASATGREKLIQTESRK